MVLANNAKSHANTLRVRRALGVFLEVAEWILMVVKKDG
jgi:hypothetical protein